MSGEGGGLPHASPRAYRSPLRGAGDIDRGVLTELAWLGGKALHFDLEIMESWSEGSRRPHRHDNLPVLTGWHGYLRPAEGHIGRRQPLLTQNKTLRTRCLVVESHLELVESSGNLTEGHPIGRIGEDPIDKKGKGNETKDRGHDKSHRSRRKPPRLGRSILRDIDAVLVEGQK